MNIQEHTTPERLERYSFFWSEARLIIAAVALFSGGIPPVTFVLAILGMTWLVPTTLTISSLISGVASIYLLYRWWKTRAVFGGKNKRDLLAFFVMIVSGINLGLTAILYKNIGMGLVSYSKTAFVATGILYLVAAIYLWLRWKDNGKKIF